MWWSKTVVNEGSCDSAVNVVEEMAAVMVGDAIPEDAETGVVDLAHVGTLRNGDVTVLLDKVLMSKEVALVDESVV